MSANAITVNELTVDYDGVTAIKDVYFAVRAEELTAIVGPNGAGKSTLIKALLGLIPTRTGTISCFGTSPKQYRKDISYVPQRAQIDWEFPANVFDVVAMGLYGELGLLRRFSSAHKDRVHSVLTDVDMADEPFFHFLHYGEGCRTNGDIFLRKGGNLLDFWSICMGKFSTGFGTHIINGTGVVLC